MFNDSDYNLEEKSRKAAEQFSDASLIPDWQQLETKLDIELPVKKKRRRMFAFWIVSAALLGSFLYIGYESGFSKKNNTNIITETTSESIKSNMQQEKALPTPETVNKDKPNTPLNQSTQFIPDNDNYRLNDKRTTYSTLGNPSGKSNLKLDKTTDIDNTSITQKTDAAILKSYTKKLPAEKIETDKLISLSSINAENKDLKKEKNDNNEKVTLTTETNNKLGTAKFSDSSFSGKEKISAVKLDTDKPITKKEKPRHPFSVAAVAGGNVNSVWFNKSSGIGFDYGLLLGYKLSPTLEIQTGVIFSRKYFTTTGQNISFDSAKLNLPSYTSVKLEDATGYCRFFEVPVMLYYSFPAKSKTIFYAGAGFSINKMRMEKIDYTFLINSNTTVERTHTGAYHSPSGFSTSVTSNLSFGLKQKLSERWNFSFEPYLKIPLTKVNDSDLKLTTLGSSASLIFNLPNKKKK